MLHPLTVTDLDRIFNSLRSAAIGGSQAYVKIAFSIACLLVLISLVRLAYDIISDEQHGGFGGVKLKDILIPIALLALIQGAPLFLRAFDDVVGWVVSSVAGSVVVDNADAAFEANMKAIEDAYQETAQAELDAKLAEREDEDGMFAGLINWLKDTWEKMKTGFKNMMFGASTKIGVRFIPWLCVQLFKILTICYMVIANVFLCILAIAFPFTVCLELSGIWKGNLKGFIVKYVQVSFWRVIIALILWCISSVRVVMSSKAVSDIVGSGMSADNMLSSVEATAFMTAIICIAGCMCLQKVPEWAAAVIGGGASEASGGAGGVAAGMNGQPGRAAKSGVSAANSIHSSRQGAQSAANIEKAAASTLK